MTTASDLADELDETLEFISPTGALAFLKRRGSDLAAAIKALQFGFDLYGYDAPDGPWPIERALTNA